MNANELIEFQEDNASEARANGFSDVRFMHTATMLRQQQAEIEALRKEIKDKHTKSILRSLGHE